VPLENQKHEKFCQVWHETGNKSEAYRQSHPNSAKWKDVTVHNKASELSKRGEVSVRLEQLQNDAVKAHGITIESLLAELDEARTTAQTAPTPQASAMVTATMSKAKLVGLDRIILDTTIKIVDDGSDGW
jgi:hypothetical protein